MDENYWRGQADARMTDAERRLDALNGNIEKTADRLGKLETAVATLRTKVAIWSAIGAAVGAGAISALASHL